MNTQETKNEKAIRIFNTVTRDNSSCSLGHSCLYLMTVSDMQSEQKSWCDGDEQKDTDLTTSKAWLWGDGFLLGIDSADELLEHL